LQSFLQPGFPFLQRVIPHFLVINQDGSFPVRSGIDDWIHPECLLTLFLNDVEKDSIVQCQVSPAFISGQAQKGKKQPENTSANPKTIRTHKKPTRAMGIFTLV